MGCLGQLFHLSNRTWHENSWVNLPFSSNNCQGEGGKEGQAGQGLEQAGRHPCAWQGMEWDGFKVPSEPNPSGIPWLCGSCCSLSLLCRASTGLPFQQEGAAQLPLDLQSRLWCEEVFPYGLLKGWGGFGVHPI